MYSVHPKYGGLTLETVLTFTHPSVAWEGAWSESAQPLQWGGLHTAVPPHKLSVGHRKAAYAQAVLWLSPYVYALRAERIQLLVVF